MQQCFRCKEYKELTCFYKDRWKRLGYSTECKDCHKSRKVAKGKILGSKYYIRKIASEKVYRAVVRGIISRPDNCERCSNICKPEAHHSDYRKPLDVTWLCRECHIEVHRETEPIYA